MAMTGHKSTEMVRRYIKEANLFKNNALNKIKIWYYFKMKIFCDSANYKNFLKYKKLTIDTVKGFYLDAKKSKFRI